MIIINNIDEFWLRFLKSSGRVRSTKYFEAFHFTDNEKVANELLALVLEGKKTATTSAFPAYNDNMPSVGTLSIVTDYAGKPYAVIETTSVLVFPFDEMTYEICKREGEDDNLESWRKSHKKVFTAEAEELGYEFSEKMPIVFEDFKVIYRE